MLDPAKVTTSNGPASSAGKRSRRTRELLVRAAEQIVAERGPAALSLRNAAFRAGQGNTNAAIYHFKTTDNLIWNVIEGRAAEMEVLRSRNLAAAIESGKTDDLPTLFSCLLDPIAEIVDSLGDHIYARFQLQLYINNHRYSHLLNEIITPEYPARSNLIELLLTKLDRSPASNAHSLLRSLLILPFNIIHEHDLARKAGKSPPPLAGLCKQAYAIMASAFEKKVDQVTP